MALVKTATATAEVFWTAFRALSRSEKLAIVGRLLRDRHFREDLIDAATIEQRRREPAQSLVSYLKRRAKRRRG